MEQPKTRPQRSSRTTVAIRPPRASDGAAVWRLIRDAEALDDNSLYCNLLQCSHLSATCAVAEMQGEVVGWMSGYVPPDKPETLFVWQICVGEQARGRGLAKRLVADVLGRPECEDVRSAPLPLIPPSDACAIRTSQRASSTRGCPGVRISRGMCTSTACTTASSR